MEWSRFIVKLSNSNKIHWSYLVCLVIFSQVSLFVTAESALGKNQKPVGKGSLRVPESGFRPYPVPAPAFPSSTFNSIPPFHVSVGLLPTSPLELPALPLPSCHLTPSGKRFPLQVWQFFQPTQKAWPPKQ